LLGSVASDIARRAPTCSLVIPPPPEVAEEARAGEAA